LSTPAIRSIADLREIAAFTASRDINPMTHGLPVSVPAFLNIATDLMPEVFWYIWALHEEFLDGKRCLILANPSDVLIH
jgi:hypothetical protein